MSTVLPTQTHDWVKWTVTAVGVIVDPFSGEASVVESEDIAVGEQVGCSSCGEPLTDSSAVSACEGSTDLP